MTVQIKNPPESNLSSIQKGIFHTLIFTFKQYNLFFQTIIRNNDAYYNFHFLKQKKTKTLYLYFLPFFHIVSNRVNETLNKNLEYSHIPDLYQRNQMINIKFYI